MKNILLILAVLLTALQLPAQILTPVKWSTAIEQVSAQEFDLIFTADIDEGWVVYSQFIEDGGPIPTAFYFDEGDHYEKVGKTEESGKIKRGYEAMFDMELIKLYDKGIFTQRVRVSDPSQPVTGYLEFMTCNDEKCLPPTEEEFSFDVSAFAKKETAPAPEKTAESIPSTEKAEPAEEEMLAPPTDDLFSGEIAPGANISDGIFDPIQWSGELKKLDDQTYELHIHGQIEESWAVYSQYLESEDGPIPTAFYFEEADHYQRVGKVEESGKKKEGYDPVFGMNLTKFYEKLHFVQKITVNDPAQPVIGVFEYMTCNDERCLPAAEIAFRAEPAAGTLLVGAEAEAPLATPGSAPGARADLFPFDKPDLDDPAGQCGETHATAAARPTGYWSIFGLGFLGGLLALLTPCVFPMIPLTVSFFTKSSGNRRKGLSNASLYGLFILLVYLLLSIPFHLMDSINPDILNDISTNVWLNLAFFAIFVFFAFSFFGYYELTLPSSWTNKASSAEGVGGIVGIFFMALTLALVSFSCTGPILGSLLAGALTSTGGAWQLSAGMGGFGLALALPFTVFAAFPGMMNALPKSGGWLNTVKVVLGFLELALAMKFLSNADLVKHWGLLKIEPFLALWMIIFAGLALYLFGLIRFPHDTPVKFKDTSWVRRFLGVTSLAFVVYLGFGFTYDKQADSYQSLKLLSGLAPPVCYSWFQPCDCPQNLSCFRDFEEGMSYAREVDKPVMLDFTGHACVNCRKMEEHVWPEREVYKHLKNDYVLISLYVDEKIDLPAEEQIVVPKTTGGTRKLRTTGQKWSYFQTEYFRTNSQPYYVLLSPDGHLLNQPVGYTPDSEEYAGFLECGLNAYRELTEKKQEAEKRLGSTE